MEVDFAVELGPTDETLEFPWSAGDRVQYYDLKRQPELLALIEEAHDLKPLSEFLAAINSPASSFETAKCDTWSTAEMNPEEEIFGAACKFGSYVDLLFCDERRFSFSEHETGAKRWTALLQRVPEIPAAAEFIIRRCFFQGEVRDGFYITMYSFGYGEDEDRARIQWAIGLKVVENAIRQACS